MYGSRVRSLARVRFRLGTVGGGLQFRGVFRGFYDIMSFCEFGASGKSRHFTNFSLLLRFDPTCRRGPNIHFSETMD